MRLFRAIMLSVLLIALVTGGWWIVRIVWLRPANIDHFFERAYIEFLWDDPELLTVTGVLRPYGFGGDNGSLTDASPARSRRLAEIGRRNLRILRQYDSETLNPAQQVSYDVFHWFLSTGVDGEPFLFHDYPVTHLTGPHVEIPQFMMHTHPVECLKDAEDYLKRLSQIGEKFVQTVDALALRRDSGIIAPTFILQKAIRHCDDFVAIPIDANPLITSFAKRLALLGTISPEKRGELVKQCRQHIIDHVYPAYRRLSAYLMVLESESMAIAGVWHLPDGDAYYRHCLLQQTTLHLDPEELYAYGRMEMSRIEGEMHILLNLMRYPQHRSVSEILRQMADDRFITFGTDSAGQAAILDHFRRSIGDIGHRLPKYFHDLPKAELEIHTVPEYRAETSPLAFYVPPKGNPIGPGRLFVNTMKADRMPYFLATTYAYHEGLPGHHLQKAIQVEMTGLPQFRRFLPFPAFSEGWAMYAEELGHEMTGTDDPLDRLGQLQSDLFRTARLITDVGIHHRKWMRGQAVQFMMENAGLTLSEAEDEVDRYIVWPGQGCAYKVGKMKFLELRDRFRMAKGGDYDPRDFHRLLIGNGAMPLEVLEQEVNRAIGQ